MAWGDHLTVTERRDLRVATLAVLIAGIFGLRLGIPDPGLLEILPVLLAAYWFGSKGALRAGVAAGALLAIVPFATDEFEAWSLAVRLPLLIVPGYLVGRQLELRAAESDELARLRSVQNALAPLRPPDLPLLDVAARYLPAERGVGGDFYLIVEGHNNSTIVVVADVVGKGMNAARRATFVRATLTACAPYSEDPVHLLRMANAELIRQYGVSAEFITMLCVVVRPDGSLTWASAGHPAPVSLADGEPIGAPESSYPLGIAPELTGHAWQTRLPEAGVLLYTDGLTDARPSGRSYEPFGNQRLARALSELDDPTPEEAVERLVAAVHTFARGSLPDDLCLVALRSKLPRYSPSPAVPQREAAPSAS